MIKNETKSLIVPAILISISLLLFSAEPASKPFYTACSKNGFVLVELFTSEGCSSCPAADEAVAAIAHKYKEQVFVLGFHVDYWNRLGWKDQFSNAAYSNRQKEYASSFSLNSIYTPQVVVNGREEMVGSNKRQLEETIESELDKNIPFTLQVTATFSSNANITVLYSTNAEVNNKLNIALVQLNASTQVKSGENNGRTLSHINIVRSFQSIDLKEMKSGKLSIKLPDGLTFNQFRLIAFTQDKVNYHITSIAATSILQ